MDVHICSGSYYPVLFCCTHSKEGRGGVATCIIIIVTICKYFDPCYARATVVRARFLAAAFSDGSYLAHVNGAYLRHVTFCIVRGPPLFIVSPICECGSRAAAHLKCRGTPASPILSRNVMSRLPWTPASPILAAVM